MSPEFTKKFKALQVRCHDETKSDPVYMEGYNGPNTWEEPYPACPYRFNKKLDLERMRISMVEGPLSGEQRNKLTKLNARFAKTKWDRWQRGNYYRWCVENA